MRSSFHIHHVGSCLAFVLVTFLGVSACTSDATSGEERWDWDLPEGVPIPVVPEDNPMSVAKVELGRMLFYDTRLSGNETQSCASCHVQELAFADGRAQGLGATGELHPRSPMGLTNVAYNSVQTWVNPVLRTLESQALVPLLGEDPVELGITTFEQLKQRLEGDERYVAGFRSSFPEDSEPISEANVSRALAAFERTLISANSSWDQYQRGDSDAVSESAKRGAELFFSERLECFHCHGGFNFSDSMDHNGLIAEQVAFHNNGLYSRDELGSYPAANPGLFEFTRDDSDRGKFRAPTLRNIEVTAPYMHDGSLLTLRDVVAHYARGGTLTESGPNAGDGALNPNKSSFVAGFVLTEQEEDDLVEFLQSLTDESFLTDPRFSDPFASTEESPDTAQ